MTCPQLQADLPPFTCICTGDVTKYTTAALSCCLNCPTQNEIIKGVSCSPALSEAQVFEALAVDVDRANVDSRSDVCVNITGHL